MHGERFALTFRWCGAVNGVEEFLNLRFGKRLYLSIRKAWAGKLFIGAAGEAFGGSPLVERSDGFPDMKNGGWRKVRVFLNGSHEPAQVKDADLR